MKCVDIEIVPVKKSIGDPLLIRWNTFFRRGVQIGTWLFIGFFCLIFVSAFLFPEGILPVIFTLCSFTFAGLSILSQKLAEKGSEIIASNGLSKFSLTHGLKVLSFDEKRTVSFPEMMVKGGEPEVKDVLLGESEGFSIEYFSYADSVRIGKKSFKRSLFVHHIDTGYALPEFLLYKSDLAEKEIATGQMQRFFDFQVTGRATQISFAVEGVGNFILLVEKQYEIEALQICTEQFVKTFAEQSAGCILQSGNQDLYIYTYGLPEQDVLQGYQVLFSVHQLIVSQFSVMARSIGGSVEALRERTSVLPLSGSDDVLTQPMMIPIDDAFPELVLWEGKCYRPAMIIGWIIAFFVLGVIIYGATFISNLIAFLLGMYLFVFQVSSLFDYLASEYRVTNKRVVIRYGWKKKKVTSISRSIIHDVQIKGTLFLWLFDVASLRLLEKSGSRDNGVFDFKSSLFYVKDYTRVKDMILKGS